MASDPSNRDSVIAERLNFLHGAIQVMKKMVGNLGEDWVAESAQAASSSAPAAPKQVYLSATKYLHEVTTKFTLIFKDAKTPDEVGTYAETMERALVGLVQSSQTLLKTINAHELLINQVNTLVLDTLDVVSKLSTTMATSLSAKDANRLTGQIWANCETLEKLDLDATVQMFVSKAIKAQLGSIKDALTELEEEEQNENGFDDEELSDTEEGDILNFSLKPEDRKILPGCILVLKTASSFCTQISKVTGLIDDRLEQDETRAVLLKIYEKTNRITEAVDDFNVSIYPPQKPDDVLQQAIALKDLLTSVIQLLTTLKQLSAHHDKLKQLQTTAGALFLKAEESIKHP